MTDERGKQAARLDVPESGASVSTRALGADSALRDMAEGSELFARLKNSLKKVVIDGKTYYVAEGDTLLDEAQLATYSLEREAREKLRAARRAASEAGLGTIRLEGNTRGLVAQTQGGKIVRWRPGTVLSYRVIRETFPDQESYELVVSSMRAACLEWEQTCGVDFKHMSELDGRPGTAPEGALFTVRAFDAGGEFIAAAFFPNDPKDRRHVLVDPSYYTTSFDPVGVFRHELGHVLGFRHEHIRSEAPPDCPDEELFDTRNLGKYDPQSVMHYFCGEVGSSDLRITDLDRSGSQQVYGPPLSAVAEV
ncbi:MAG TPA: matrixin family metalloprotease [Allosphingosinicella sp.]|jgi:hypothetical protein